MPAVLPDRLLQFAALLTLKPFDGATADGRARERHRRVALSAVAAATAKLLSVATALISVPLTLHYLGGERYGMWMTMSSVIAMLAFADLGMGNGLINAVAESHGRDDNETIRKQVSSGFFILSLIAVVIVVLFSAVYSSIGWYRIFNVQSALAQAEAGPALAVFAACFALNIPLGIVQRVQTALQQGFTASLWQCLGSVLGLAGVLLAIHLEGGLPWLIGAMVGAPLFAALGNSIHFFFHARPDLSPAIRFVSRAMIQRIARTGVLFLVLQIVVAVAYASDNIVIAQMLGASAVTEYAVPEKMFSLITVLLGMVLAPLWPAYGEAIARGDSAWVRQTLKRSLITAVSIAAVLSSLLVLFGDRIISAWVGHEVSPPFLLLVGLGAWKILEAAGSALAAFLNGANVLRLQMLIASVMGITAIALKFILVVQIGLPGVVLATILAYLLLVLLPWIFFLPGVIGSLNLKEAPL
jgi:O-antigen/teichoic acid export membrane protein